MFEFCLASSLGFFLKEPDVEQDLDWTVAENQRKTHGSKSFSLVMDDIYY